MQKKQPFKILKGTQVIPSLWFHIVYTYGFVWEESDSF